MEREDTTVKISELWIDRLFAISLALLGLSSLVLSITGLAGIALPDWATRLLGVVSLVALPVTVYSTVKSFQEKLNMRKAAQSRGANKKKRRKK